MRCPKCGYISFDRQKSCGRCGNDLTAVAEQLKGTADRIAVPFFLGAILGKQKRTEVVPVHEKEEIFGLDTLVVELPAADDEELDFSRASREEEKGLPPSPASVKNTGITGKSAMLEDILADLCRRGGFSGAMIADDMGLPVAVSHLRQNQDALAALATVMGESLKQADAILDLKEAETLSLWMSKDEKIILRSFTAQESKLYLLVFAPTNAEPASLLNKAVSIITAALASG